MAEKHTIYNLIRQILRSWFAILTVSLMAAFLAGIGAMAMYTPTYRTQALITVYSRNSSSVVYKAQEAADVFSEVLTSNLLQKKVAAEIGREKLPGSVACSNIKNTNIITLTVTAATPQDAMTTMNAVLDHHNVVTEKLLSGMVLQVLEAPMVPTAPVNAYRGLRVLVMALAAAAIAQVCVLFVVLYFRDDIKHERQVEEKLDTKLFATVYHEDLNKGFRFLRRRKKQPGLLVTNPLTSFGYIETLQKMCVKLEYQAKDHDLKTLVISSVQENEGKSTIAANMALTLAKMGRSVVLVDMDLRKPAVFKLFETAYGQSDIQIGDLLAGDHSYGNEALRQIAPNLYLLAGKRSYSNVERMLDRMGLLLERLKAEADYVIVDTPPMSAAADAEAIMQHVDASLLIVRQNGSIVKDINDAVDLFRSAGCVLLGCVFNNVEVGLPGSHLLRDREYGYRKGYRYYYGK